MGLSAAICCLETFVHQAGRPQFPMTITRFKLPDDPKLYLEPDISDLPEGWDSLPSDKPSVDFGSRWIRERKQLGLIVPSVVLPLERNIVINPAHPALHNIEIEEISDFRYDDRMFKTTLA